MSLLPCPHCGGKAKCLSMQVAFSHHRAWRAYCDTTFCTDGFKRSTEAEAIAASPCHNHQGHPMKLAAFAILAALLVGCGIPHKHHEQRQDPPPPVIVPITDDGPAVERV